MSTPVTRSAHAPTEDTPGSDRWWRRHAGLLVAGLLALVLFSPWLWGTGYLLHYDLVFVPHLTLSPGTLGLDGDVPRAVPNDVVVALLDLVLPGWFVERLVLLGFVLLVGAGVDRWTRPTLARLVAVSALVWNPWTGERLGIGHWGYLWGYAGLVWVVVGATQLRRAGPRSARDVGTTVMGVLVGSLSGSTGGVLVGVAALLLLGWPGPGRMRVRTLGLGALWWLALAAAWWFPFLTLAPSGVADADGVAAFAARADSPAGLWASLASGGGIWHRASWFASRSSAVPVVLMAVGAVVGIAMVARSLRARGGAGVVAMAVVGLVLAGAAGIPGGSRVVAWFVLQAPGGGLLRDGQKFVALWWVPAGLGLGLLVARVVERTRGTLLAPSAVAAGLLLPLATLPGLAWCAHGTWQGASYPDEVRTVAARLGAHPADAVAVFPWQLYRRYSWNHGVTVLDPWQRLVPNRVLIDDDLPLDHGVVAGENPTARALGAALARRDTAEMRRVLRGAGVRYVLEQKDQPPGAGRAPALGSVVHDGPVLQVQDLGAPSRRRTVPWWAPAGLLISAAAALMVPVGLRRGRHRRTRS